MKYFEDVDSMQALIDDYFWQCDKQERPYTIEGLARHLKFQDTDSLLNYEKGKGYEKFFGIIKDAKLKIQQQRIEWGISDKGNPSFIKFVLINNSNYKSERQVIENRNYEMSEIMTDAELEEIAKREMGGE